MYIQLFIQCTVNNIFLDKTLSRHFKSKLSIKCKGRIEQFKQVYRNIVISWKYADVGKLLSGFYHLDFAGVQLHLAAGRRHQQVQHHLVICGDGAIVVASSCVANPTTLRAGQLAEGFPNHRISFDVLPVVNIELNSTFTFKTLCYAMLC